MRCVASNNNGPNTIPNLPVNLTIIKRSNSNGNGNKTRLNLGVEMGMGMGMNH